MGKNHITDTGTLFVCFVDSVHWGNCSPLYFFQHYFPRYGHGGTIYKHAVFGVDLRLLQGSCKSFADGCSADFYRHGYQPQHKTRMGLVVYLSLVSLLASHENSVDLVDLSAQKAIRIASLTPGQESDHGWKMPLIRAGPFGAALTIIGQKNKNQNRSNQEKITLPDTGHNYATLHSLINNSSFFCFAWMQYLRLFFL